VGSVFINGIAEVVKHIRGIDMQLHHCINKECVRLRDFELILELYGR